MAAKKKSAGSTRVGISVAGTMGRPKRVSGGSPRAAVRAAVLSVPKSKREGIDFIVVQTKKKVVGGLKLTASLEKVDTGSPHTAGFIGRSAGKDIAVYQQPRCPTGKAKKYAGKLTQRRAARRGGAVTSGARLRAHSQYVANMPYMESDYGPSLPAPRAKKSRSKR